MRTTGNLPAATIELSNASWPMPDTLRGQSALINRIIEGSRVVNILTAKQGKSS